MTYVSIAGDKRIVVMELDGRTGDLRPRGHFDLAGDPGPLMNDPRRNILYVGVRSQKSVVALAIDPKDGRLEALRITPVADIPTYLATDPDRRYLLTAFFRAARVGIYRVQCDGTIEPEAVSLVATDANPHAIQTDRTGRFIFVPATGADAVCQYRFDSTVGRLTPNCPSELKTGPGTGPRHFRFHPTADVVYVVNEKGSSVAVCRLNTRRGTLESVQTLSTLPSGHADSNACAHVEITPNGCYLYASNRGHDSLAIFSIDQKHGTLTKVGTQRTEQTPRSFAIEPNGRYLIVAGQGSDRLATYRIGPDGLLLPLKVYPVGKRPVWVQIVPLP